MIGQYLIRSSDSGAAVTVAHLVESEIADRVVTYCGNQMHRHTSRGSLRPASPADPYCLVCPPKERTEDIPEPISLEQDDFDGPPA